MSQAALAPEEQARANFYALLARLFFAPPDRALLDALATSGDLAGEGAGAPLARAWRDLVAAAAQTQVEAAREEYEAAFLGTGKAEVTLYASAYLGHSERRNPLVEIRDFLARRNLQRKDSVHEPEDHLAGLCDVMRHLIVTEDAAVQREFFESFLGPASGPLCDAILACDGVRFYRQVARFGKNFFALEHIAFDMD